MTAAKKAEMIPIEKIHVLNPRARNKAKFKKIVDSIARVGLKRPIKVSRRTENGGGHAYDLVCGQGRLEAFVILGQAQIPAIVEDMPKISRLEQSLVENIARRNRASMDLVKEIDILQQREYTAKQIADKIDISYNYVTGIMRLLRNGEEGLLRAVDTGKISVNIAAQIGASENVDVQRILTDAYEKKVLTGKALLQAKRIVEQRVAHGKAFGHKGRRNGDGGLTSSEFLVRAYNQQAERQKILIKKAKACEAFLVFIVSALQELFQDENFMALLDEESLDTLPTNLAERIKR